MGYFPPATFVEDINTKDKVYSNGVPKMGTVTCFTSGTVTNGIVTWYLTKDETASGEAIFPNEVYQSSCRPWINDASSPLYTGSYNLSADRKTLTMEAKKPATAGLTILGVTTTVLIPTVANIPNGTIIYLAIRGR